MTAAEILLKIRALFDRRGVDEAKEATDNLGQAGKDAGDEASEGFEKAADAAKDAGEAAEDGLGKVGDAAGEAGDALKKTGEDAEQMGEAASSASVLAAGNIAKVTTVVTALAGIIKMVNEALVEGAHLVDGIKADNMAAGVESSAAAVERLNNAYARAAEMRDRLATAQQAGIDMLREEELAALELAKAQELAAAKDDDERKRIELRYAERWREVSSRREAQSTRVRQEQLIAESQANDQRLADLEEMRSAAWSEAAETNEAAMSANQRAGEKEASYWTRMKLTGPLGFQQDAAATRKEADTLRAAADKAAENYKAIVDEIESLKARQGEIAIERERLSSNVVVAARKDEAERIGNQTASRDLEQSIAERKAEEERRSQEEERAAARKAKIAELNAGIERNNERGAALADKYNEMREAWAPRIAAARERVQVERQSAATAGKIYGSFRRKGTDSTVGGYDKVVVAANERAQAAAGELSAMERELKSTLDAITDELKRLKEDSKNKAKQIRNLPD